MIHIEMWQVWSIVSLGLFVAELFYPVFFFAALGVASAVTVIASLFLNTQAQLGVFSFVSLVVFFAVRPKILKRLYSKDNVKTNTDAMIGKKGIVIEDILPNRQGRIKIGDETWIGVSTNNEKIEKENVVVVERVEGVKLYVKKENL
jgi:membrane protein implicated in regulation of membrane protease activity